MPTFACPARPASAASGPEGRRGAKRATTTAPDESVKVVPKDEDEPLSLPAVIAIVSIGSVSGLVILWVQFKKRLRWY